MKFFRSIPVQRHIVLILLILFQGIVHGQDTLNIMYYNVLNYPGSTSARVNYFRIINQYLEPDIIVATEVLSEAGVSLLLEDGLNVYNTSRYSAAPFIDGPDTDNMLFYNHENFGLYSQDTIQTALRLINEYILYYKSEGLNNGSDTVFLVFYSAHLKAGTTTADKQKRYEEVQRLKQHLLSLSNPKNVIFGGDLNLYTSSEAAYQSLINDPPVFYDPLPAGTWHDNFDFTPYHTQSPRTAQFGGGATGGMDDRFDFILFSDDLINGTYRASYVPNSCYAVGNDGNHLNLSILDPPAITSVPDSVLIALYNMSDHLPVLCKIAIQDAHQPQDYVMNLKVFLEGSFNISDMKTDLISEIPLEQPYSAQPWNYAGSEMLEYIPENMVDWVLVEVRDATAPGLANGNTMIARKAGLLLKDGTITTADGNASIKFTLQPQNNLYIAIYHRNHLPVLSNLPLTEIEGTYSYDFTNAAGHIFGGMSACKELAENIWGMIAGDASSNGTIDQTDIENIWSVYAGKSGYLFPDLNLNGQVDNLDKNQFIIPNLDQHSYIPE
ncbi:MAG: endonuclease/exonuclease/phosphatase family protein [Bacteroidales bacterium]|nr:endonuclease/exonuclease/phosphatase family protein [Bacteroidales bacterium]